MAAGLSGPGLIESRYAAKQCRILGANVASFVGVASSGLLKTSRGLPKRFVLPEEPLSQDGWVSCELCSRVSASNVRLGLCA